MRKAYVFDQTRCLSCKVCAIACKDWNQVEPGPVRWRKAITYETNSDPYFLPLAMSCNHCEDPACKKACAVGAIIKRQIDGIVYVDREKCQSLQACITACPFAEPQIADDYQEPNRIRGWQVNHPVQKCIYCMDKVEGKPVCVEACPTHALDSGDYDQLKAKYPDAVQLNPTDFPYAYVNNKTDTNPSFLIIKRKPMKFTENID